MAGGGDTLAERDGEGEADAGAGRLRAAGRGETDLDLEDALLIGWGLRDGLWLLRGSGVRDTLRMGLPLCEGDCLRWLDGDVLKVSKRP